MISLRQLSQFLRVFIFATTPPTRFPIPSFVFCGVREITAVADKQHAKEYPSNHDAAMISISRLEIACRIFLLDSRLKSGRSAPCGARSAQMRSSRATVSAPAPYASNFMSRVREVSLSSSLSVLFAVRIQMVRGKGAVPSSRASSHLMPHRSLRQLPRAHRRASRPQTERTGRFARDSRGFPGCIFALETVWTSPLICDAIARAIGAFRNQAHRRRAAQPREDWLQTRCKSS